MTAAQALGRARTFDVVCSADAEAEWLRHRRTGIGASEMARVLGVAPVTWGGAFALYTEKVTGWNSKPELDEVEAVEWGKLLEPVILGRYERVTGRKTRKSSQLLRSREYPWALCTLDGITTNPERAREQPLEVKTTAGWMADHWVEGPPEHYLVQVHQQMLVTGQDCATVVCLLGGQRMVWCDVQRDESLIRRIIHHGERFWNCVTTRTPPPVDDSQSCAKALAVLHPDDKGAPVLLTHDTAQVVARWRELKAQHSAIAKELDACENLIKSELKDSRMGILPDRSSVSWKKQARAGYTVEPCEYKVLRYHAPKGK